MNVEPWQLVVLLGAFAAVAAFAAPRRKSGSQQAGSGTERMQEALEQFMAHMEEDNRDIVDSIAKLQQQQREDNAARDERIAALERRCTELEDKLGDAERRLEERADAAPHTAAESASGDERRVVQAERAAAHEERPSAIEPPPSDDGRTPIRERYAELFELHAQGKSTDVIAKRVGMHKGEVMLILQLAKQEEESRV